MKQNLLKILFCLSITYAMAACKAGPAGDIGPSGVQGPAGTDGTNNSVKGPIGDAGPAGDQGPQGATGVVGAQGDSGTANVFTSGWKKLDNWTQYTQVGQYQRYYQADVNIPELTKEDLNSSIILVYVRRVGNLSIVELTPKVSYTLNGDPIYFHSASENMITFQHDGFYTSTNASGVVAKLNGYQVEARITIIRGTKKN